MLRLPEPERAAENPAAEPGGSSPETSGSAAVAPGDLPSNVARIDRKPANPLFRGSGTDVSDDVHSDKQPPGAPDGGGAGERGAGDEFEAARHAAHELWSNLISHPIHDDSDFSGERDDAKQAYGAASGEASGEARRVRTGEVGGRGSEAVCEYGCPLCAAMSAMHELQPETMDHLAVAAREFMTALRSFASTLERPAGGVTRRVQRFRP